MTSSVVPKGKQITKSRISSAILKQFSSNLAPIMFISQCIHENDTHWLVAMATVLLPDQVCAEGV